MSWKPGSNVFSFDGRRYEPGKTYTWSEVPEAVRDDVINQVQSWPERELPERTPEFRFYFISPADVTGLLFERYGPMLQDRMEEDYIQELVQDIKKNGLRHPPVGDEGQHRMLALGVIGKGAPYFSFDMPGEEEFPRIRTER